MKLPTPFSIHDLRLTIWKKSSVRDFTANRKSPIANHKSTAGIALVITLILLSVTLIMAVAFLAIARRERNSVTTTTDTATARLATDTALAAAQAQIAANILASTNLAAYTYSLLVSTNYINPAGYFPGVNAPTNVNYDYRSDNLPLNSADLINNIANLYLLPRAPVFYSGNDFRFYLDLNRNGQFEANGFVPNVDSTGTTNSTILQTGDPEWVGILERPDQPHSPNNKFVARYAFFAQPVGNGLDLNYAHNESFAEKVNPAANGNDSFLRNQGVGSWEMNLAAFLADLNTNQWNNAATQPYQYYEPSAFNQGYAFQDALSFLSYRYANNYSSLATLGSQFANGGALENQPVDMFPLGVLMTNTSVFYYLNNTNNYWAGSPNPNRYFALPSELFDSSKTAAGLSSAFVTAGNYFSGRLANAGATVAANGARPTYDRYTFYRMLDQLGTDSTVDDARMNLNYDNLDAAGNVIAGAETNCIAWTPLRFFTNAANILLQHYTAKWATEYDNNHNPILNTKYVASFNTKSSFGVTHIPVLVSNVFVYTPAVNRLLQLAANIYDATTNSPWPSVFRPTFTKTAAGDVYITGYVEAIDSDVTIPPIDISAMVVGNSQPNVYGVPWIIGAKKGLPNFNGFYMRPTVQVTRKLRVTRSNGLKPGALGTNEMFVMSITNQIGFSFWNSYKNDYVSTSGGLKIYFSDIVSTRLVETNAGVPFYPAFTSPALNPNLVQFQFTTNITTWPGAAWGSGSPEGLSASTSSFFTGVWDYQFLPESVYRFAATSFDATASAATLWETNGINAATPPVLPQFGLQTTNRVQAYILDGTHILDYVQLDGPNISPDFSDQTYGLNDAGANAGFWNTNGNGVSIPRPASPTWGVVNQISTSKNSALTTGNNWVKPSNMPGSLNTPTMESAYFNAFFVGGSVKGSDGKNYSNTNLASQAPYTPSRTFWQYTLWQVNDPLVHYTVGDLNTANNTAGPGRSDDSVVNKVPAPSLTSLTTMGNRYQPWGRNSQMATFDPDVDSDDYNLRYRDPLVWGSDYWDFPTGKLPNVGWLGRVHRGTPWQSVYLKQRDVLLEATNTPSGIINIGTNTWAKWTGNTQNDFDAANSAPISDRDLFDLFTTAPSPNATRGTLSVNQTHLASWSALFSGVVALTNATDVPMDTTTPIVTNMVISPAGADTVYSPVSKILNGTVAITGADGINATRQSFTNADGVVGAFEHIGDILNVPAYTEHSPFINRVDGAAINDRLKFDISDELYEWLPQQTLGLLRASSTPRFVIYCYGQTLRPAANGLVTDTAGGQFGLCTNYSVTAESAARAVIRVENAKTKSPHIVVESFNALPPN